MENIVDWVENAEAKVGSFIKTEIDKIAGDVATKVAPALTNAATIADNLVNALKNEIETPTGKTILSIVEEIVPGAYVNTVLGFLPNLVAGLNWVKGVFTSWENEALVKSALTTAVNAATSDIKASNLITLQGHINTQLTAAMGAALSIQASVSQAATVHVVNAVVPVPPIPPVGGNTTNAPAADINDENLNTEGS